MWTDGGQISHVNRAVFKGGGGPEQVPPEPKTWTDPVDGTTYGSVGELNAHIQERKNQEKGESDRKAAEQAQKDLDTRNTFTAHRSDARSQAFNDVANQFWNQGVDPALYVDKYINPALNKVDRGIADLDPNPYAAYTDDLGSRITNSILNDKRSRAEAQVNKTFDPSFTYHTITDTSLDPYVSKIVSEQFDPVAAQLENARKRGTFNDAGYQHALDVLSQKRSSAEAQVRSLGQGVLGTERNELNDYITGATKAASGLGLGDTFDIGNYTRGAANLVNADVTGLGGKVRTAVGDTKFIDLVDLLNAGGALQGATSGPYSIIQSQGGGNSLAAQTEDELARRRRGLGNTGAF